MCKSRFGSSKFVSSFLAGFLVLIIIIGLPMSTVYAQTGIVWQKASESIPVSINTVTYGNGLYVAVGQKGIIKTSTDVENWTSQESGVSENLFTVVWNGEMFIAGGKNGTLVSSTDGVDWKVVSFCDSEHRYDLRSILWDGNQFVAAGALNGIGTIFTSPDGLNWTLRISHIHEGFESVNWNGSVYVAVGLVGTIYTSKDSVNWTPVQSGTKDHLYDITNNGEIFVISAGADILTSPNGITWTKTPLSGGTDDILWDGKQFIATNHDGRVSASPDGISWTNISDTDAVLGDVIFNNGKYVAVGYTYGYLSEDCINWTPYKLGMLPKRINSVCYNGTTFVAAGTDGTILTSVDGNKWTPVESGSYDDINDVVWNGETFTAVGDFLTILMSSDGTNWTTVLKSYMSNLYKAIPNGGYILGVGDLSHVTQTYHDGSSTQILTLSSQNYDFKDVIWNGKKLIAVGSVVGKPYGVVAISADKGDWISMFGGVWTCNEVEETPGFNSIAYNGSFYIASTENELFKSYDALTWEKLNENQISEISSVTCNGTHFIASGKNDSSDVILTSTDGTSWLTSNPNTTEDLTEISLCGNKYFAFGNNGTLLTGTPTEVLLGDVNNDGNVDAIDLALMKQYLLTNNNAGINLQNADIDRDGEINSLDFTLLQKLLFF